MLILVQILLKLTNWISDSESKFISLYLRTTLTTSKKDFFSFFVVWITAFFFTMWYDSCAKIILTIDEQITLFRGDYKIIPLLIIIYEIGYKIKLTI